MKPFEWARLVCDDPRVPPMARFVAMTLAMHSRGAYAPQSRCSHSQVAQWTGLSKRTVVTAMAALIDLEYVVSVRQHAKSGARAASLHLLIHPMDSAEPVDNSPSRKGTKVQEMHQPSAGDAPRSTRAQGAEKHAPDLRRRPRSLSAGDAHLEDREEGLQDVPVLDLMSRIAAGKGMPR